MVRYIKFQILTSVNVKTVCWTVSACSLVDVYRSFSRTTGDHQEHKWMLLWWKLLLPLKRLHTSIRLNVNTSVQFTSRRWQFYRSSRNSPPHALWNMQCIMDFLLQEPTICCCCKPHDCSPRLRIFLIKDIYILILSCDLRLSFSSGLFSLGFPTSC